MCEKPVNLIVDTGADVSIIKENLLNEFQKIYINQKCTINGVTDGKVETIGRTSTNILINDTSIPHNFQVVTKNFPIQTDGILGRDFLAKYGCNICLKTWLLTFELDNQLFELPIEDKYNGNLVIPPRCQIIKQVNFVNINENSVILSKQIKPGVFCANTLINPETQYVKFVNVNNHAEIIPLDFNPEIIPANNFVTISTDKLQGKDDRRLENLLSEIETQNLGKEIETKLISLCKKYNDVFALSDEPLSVNNFYKQTINLESNAPVYIKNYRLPEIHRKEIGNQIDKMLKDKIIQPSKSPFNSPILLVPKKSTTNEKKWRLVVDFRQLNKKITADKFPLPRIDEILDHIGRAKYFSTLDLTSGFHQIELDKSSKKYTAFSSPDGHYEFNRLPFGLNISPNSFQRMMTIALSGLPPECAFLYIDDIIVMGCSVNHHLKNLESVFAKLRQHNLKLNPAKCNFFRPDVTYLGHHISEKGIQPDKSKFSAIEKYPIPNNTEDVRRFVAFCNYYRRFIKNFAEIAHPLNKLLRKNIQFEWKPECQKAFDTLKRHLLSPTILQFPNFKNHFTLITDASKVACGAVLTQKYDDMDLPIAYASKAFTRGEANKSTIEQELTAIHWAITYFRPYLYGRKFTVKTDHRPLVYLFSMKNPSSKLTRMRVDLEEFDFDVQYVPGKTNYGADALSRIKIDSETLKEMSVLMVETRAAARKNKNHIDIEQQVHSDNEETDHLNIREALNNRETFNLPKLITERTATRDGIKIQIMDKSYKRELTPASIVHTKLSDINKNLGTIVKKIDAMAKHLKIDTLALALTSEIFRITNLATFKQVCNEELKETKILISQPIKHINDSQEINTILKQYHDTLTGGHVGANRLYQKLRCQFKWHNMKKSIFDYVTKCMSCRKNKHTVKTNEKFVLTPTPQKPFDSVAMDTIGPFTKSNSGNRYALTVQCDLSKYVIIKPIPNKQADTLARAFIENVILTYGTPTIIRTDQGTEYKNEIFDKIAELLDMTHKFSTPYHPQTIGSLERNHRCLNEYIRQFVNESQTDWDDWLPYYSFCYNTTPRPDFHYTPFELIFGHQAVIPQKLMNPKTIDPNYNIDQYYFELREKLQSASLKTKQLLTSQKIKQNQKQEIYANPIDIKLEDKVLVTNENRHKLDPVYKGPYIVKNINHPNVTLVDEKNNRLVIHKNRLVKAI